METFSAILAICAGNKRLGKQSWDWWFETLSCPLWRHCNGMRKEGEVDAYSGFALHCYRNEWHWIFLHEISLEVDTCMLKNRWLNKFCSNYSQFDIIPKKSPFWLKFYCNFFPGDTVNQVIMYKYLVLVMVDAEQATGHRMNQCWPNSLKHIHHSIQWLPETIHLPKSHPQNARTFGVNDFVGNIWKYCLHWNHRFPAVMYIHAGIFD